MQTKIPETDKIIHVIAQEQIIGIHHVYLCRIGISHPRDYKYFSSVTRLCRSSGENFCPEGQISISYMNKRGDGFIFSHLKTIYLSDSFGRNMGKIKALSAKCCLIIQPYQFNDWNERSNRRVWNMKQESYYLNILIMHAIHVLITCEWRILKTVDDLFNQFNTDEVQQDVGPRLRSKLFDTLFDTFSKVINGL